MLKHPRQAGLTLIELMVAVVILGTLTALALPSFQTWMRNTQIRNAAESITNGLQRARAEAVTRNTTVEFLLSTDSSWSIDIVGGSLIDSRSGSEGSSNINIAAIAADTSAARAITFNNLGSIVANSDASATLSQVDVSASGGSRNLRVTVGVGGSTRMCDPNAPSSHLTSC